MRQHIVIQHKPAEVLVPVGAGVNGDLPQEPLADAITSVSGINIEPLQHQKWFQRMHERDFVVDCHSRECPCARVCDVSAKLWLLTEATAKQLRFVEAEVLAPLEAYD
jgi:hypothetical protein